MQQRVALHQHRAPQDLFNLLQVRILIGLPHFGDFRIDALQIRASIELAVEWGGKFFENGNAAVVICQQTFDPFQATVDRVEALVH